MVLRERCCERERRRQDGLVDGGPAEGGAVEAMEVVLALWSRPAGGGPKPPTGALAEDRCAERVGKGAARLRQVWVGKMSDGRESSAVDVSKRSQMTSEPGSHLCPGMSLGDTRLPPGRRPAYRQHEPDLGASMERVKARSDTAAEPSAARGRSPSGRNREELSTVAGRAGGLARSSCEARAYRSVGGAKGRGCPGERTRPTAREEPGA